MPWTYYGVRTSGLFFKPDGSVNLLEDHVPVSRVNAFTAPLTQAYQTLYIGASKDGSSPFFGHILSLSYTLR